MYVRVAEFTATSEIQFEMLVSFMETRMLPRNIKAGQLSGEIFRTGPHTGFVISRFQAKADADKIMKLMKDELSEIMGSTKMKLLEGPRIVNSQPK